MIEHALQRSFGLGNDLAEDLSQRLDAFSPLPFNAAMDARPIFRTHWVNLTDTLPRASQSRTHSSKCLFRFYESFGCSRAATDSRFRGPGLDGNAALFVRALRERSRIQSLAFAPRGVAHRAGLAG